MTGEIALGGVFVPTLLLLGVMALVISWGVTRLIGAFGLYRFLAYRAIVDLSIFERAGAQRRHHHPRRTGCHRRHRHVEPL